MSSTTIYLPHDTDNVTQIAGHVNDHGSWCVPRLSVAGDDVSLHVHDPETARRLATALIELGTHLHDWATDQPVPDPETA